MDPLGNRPGPLEGVDGLVIAVRAGGTEDEGTGGEHAGIPGGGAIGDGADGLWERSDLTRQSTAAIRIRGGHGEVFRERQARAKASSATDSSPSKQPVTVRRGA